MPKDITLKGFFVPQGNGNGKSLKLGSDAVLYTYDMVGCIAILIVSHKNCYLIHSDETNNTGIGKISLAQGFKDLGLSAEEKYEIGLIGGQSTLALQVKKSAIQSLLPHANIQIIKPMVDSAYLSGTGKMAESKRALREAMDANITIEVASPVGSISEVKKKSTL